MGVFPKSKQYSGRIMYSSAFFIPSGGISLYSFNCIIIMDDNKRRQIKNCFRQAMNADLSNSMRDHGLGYRMNFGVPSPRIKLIAEKFEQNAADAQYLWEEDVRESKMLATYLFPKEEMTEELAQSWAEQIRYPEIADQACMNLFVHLPFAEALAMRWIASDAEMLQYTGLRLLVRLFMARQYPSVANSELIFNALKPAMLSEVAFIRQVAMALAEKIGDATPEWQQLLTVALADWKQSDDQKQVDLYSFICYWDEV